MSQLRIIQLTLERLECPLKLLSSWVKDQQFLAHSRFPFVPNKNVINNIKLGVNQAVTIEYIVSPATSIKKRQLLFRRVSDLVSLVLIKGTCALPDMCSNFCRNMQATVTLIVALLTTELEEAEHHLQYLVQAESFETERKDLLDNISVKQSSRIAQHSPLLISNAQIRSSGCIKW